MSNNNKMKFSEMLPIAKDVANNLYNHVRVMNQSEAIRNVLTKTMNINDVTETRDFSTDTQSNRWFEGIDNRLAIIVAHDVIKCFKRLGHGDNFHSTQLLPAAIFFTRYISPNDDLWICKDILPYGLAEDCYKVILKEFNITTTVSDDSFILIESLRGTDVEQGMVNKYAVLLYQFALAIAKADNSIDDTERDWLNTILSFTGTDSKVCTKSSDKGDPMSELDSLIGLCAVKQEINSIYNLIKIQNIRKTKGLKINANSYHCVFTGNPGTGKTTVARLVARIYKELGILTKGHLVETDRSGLVAEYVGQTAVKTNKIIDSALDGVLFIDEAYSLVQGNSNDFGIEAIATLLKRMEDNRDRLVVILAGYSEEMKKFIASNPGLQSRFNRFIHFEDYDEVELLKIFQFNLSKFDYSLDYRAENELKAILHEAVARKDNNFGNARYVRNLFEKTIEKQAQRLSLLQPNSLTNEALQSITKEDIAEL